MKIFLLNYDLKILFQNSINLWIPQPYNFKVSNQNFDSKLQMLSEEMN